MYLSSIQHDQLRTLTLAFEIPYRTYIANRLLSIYPERDSFLTAMSQFDTAQLSNNDNGLNGAINKILQAPGQIYKKLECANECFQSRTVNGDQNVPNLGDLNILIYILKHQFSDLIRVFPDFNAFFSLAKKYTYARNKLSHPLSKILEESDMIPALNFMEETTKWLDSIFFWDKSQSDILKRIVSLRTGRVDIPIAEHNISAMPFPEMRIVCREKETSELKEFIYGKPGAFKKQSSYCIYGYGGLGKTALVLECVKQIVRDIIDDKTVNGYKPEFLFFFTAKEQKLTYSQTNGSISSVGVRKNFSTFADLKKLIIESLKITNFAGFHKEGIIIIDNLETLPGPDRSQLHNFIQTESPPCIQYILTSRKEEHYDINVELSGFEDANIGFIGEYVEKNDLNLELSDEEKLSLLQLSKGNTLVLVLCLSRLSRKLETLDSIRADFSKLPTTKILSAELSSLPPSGFEIISEFMFKNTFEEVEAIFSEDNKVMYQILQVFTAYDADSIDLYTISILTGIECQTVKRIADILCHYLILERNGADYSINQFAEKYIIQRFFPDSIQYESIRESISKCVRRTKAELDAFNAELKANPKRRKIINDWDIKSPGDIIAAAKVDQLYLDVRRECNRGTKFYIQNALEKALREMAQLEKSCMHPYVQYQKARILRKIDESKVLPGNHDRDILNITKNVIWTIRMNNIYSNIQHTRSFATILWTYGFQLLRTDVSTATRYLEDAKNVFEECVIDDDDYVGCLADLLHAYIESYRQTRIKGYLHAAKTIDKKIMLYHKKPKHFWKYHNLLQQY